MSEIDAPITLDQLQVFLCVVEEGSFSKAAKRLRRVQSAVSYSIANLERLLDVELFDRTGRKPALTDAGKALLFDVRAVEESVDRLHARARGIASGVEPRLSLAVDALFPMPALIHGLAAFTESFPTVDLHLRTETLGAVSQLVTDGVCQVGISIDFGDFPRGIESQPLTHVEMIPVCAPGHALAGDEPVEAELVRQQIQIVVTDRSDRTAGQDHGVVSERTWRVADLSTKRDLLLGGFGFGSLPSHLVKEDLEAGRLVRVLLADREANDHVPLCAIWRVAEPPARAGRWLIDQLTQRCQET